jgi:hypothetical protein
MARPCVIRSSAPTGLARSKSNCSDQTSPTVSALVKVNASSDAQAGSNSFPAPAVSLLGAPVTFPVSGDIPISQILLASPPSSPPGASNSNGSKTRRAGIEAELP